ncbi:hypothetical protein [Streptomyces fodineus]|nr:hypothetical protein [Streptomyces fodineus]
MDTAVAPGPGRPGCAPRFGEVRRFPAATGSVIVCLFVRSAAGRPPALATHLIATAPRTDHPPGVTPTATTRRDAGPVRSPHTAPPVVRDLDVKV